MLELLNSNENKKANTGNSQKSKEQVKRKLKREKNR